MIEVNERYHNEDVDNVISAWNRRTPDMGNLVTEVKGVEIDQFKNEHSGEVNEMIKGCNVCKGLVRGPFTEANYCFKCGRDLREPVNNPYKLVATSMSLPEKQTNADRIRAMSDEEMALFMTRPAPYQRIYDVATDKSRLLDWLRAEAKEEAE